MKNKKTLLGLILVVVILFSAALFVSCNDEGNPNTGKGEVYYLYENGELNKSDFIRLNDGKWSDDDNESGSYVLSGSSITIYLESNGEKEEFATGTLKDGVLTVTVLGVEITYCKEGKTPSVTPSTPDEPQKDDGHSIISATEGEIRGKTVTSCVFSEDGVYDLRNKFTVSEGAGWRAFTSPDCTQPTELTKRTVNIEYGWNDIYVMVENQTTYENSVYNVKIYRAPISGMELTENDTYRISEGIDFPEVILPDYYNGKKVTEIGNGAFSECKSMKTLVIGNCVTAIGAKAFGECTLLTDVVLPDSVTDVGRYAFASCTNLVSVTIGRQVAHIGYYAFSECEKLVEVINNSALKIEKGIDDDDLGRVGYYALDVRAGEKSAIDRRDGCLFYRHGDTVYLLGYTGDRTALTLPDDYDGSAYEIYKFAFYRCDTLESVIIGNSVKRIGEEAFYHCDNLRGVGIPDQITDIGEDAFYNCPITEATLPSCAISAISVKKLETVVITSGDIEKAAFYYAKNLTCVTLGTGVKTIGADAFDGSKKLKTLIINGKVTEIGASAFSDCEISDIYITDIAMWCRISGVENLMGSGSEKTLYLNGEAITDLVIPDGITAIGTSTFYGVKNLISVTVPTSVISIGKFAFRNCNSLKSITLPFVGASRTAKNGYDQVFGYIFGYRTASSGVGSGGTNQYERYYYYIPSSIRTVIISDGATAVAEKAFYRCGNLVNVVLPDSIETIGTSAFEYCDNLESIRLPFLGASRTASNGYDQVFGYIFGYTALDQQNSAMTWTYQTYYKGKWYYFNIPSSIRNVTLSSGIVSIYTAFSNCTNLKSICYEGTLDDWVQIDFESCYDLLKYADLYIQDQLVTDAVLTSATKINDYAFARYKKLKSITICSSVRTIGYAFPECENLETVSYTGTMDEWGQIEFSDYGNPLQYADKFYIGDQLVTNAVLTGASGINAFAFYGYKTLTELSIGGNVRDIGEGAFYGCTGLKTLSLGDSVTAIGKAAFRGCSSLSHIDFGSGIKTINSEAFRGCSRLTQIKLGSSVEMINTNAFYGCSLNTIEFADGVKGVYSDSLKNCGRIKNAVLPANITGKFTWTYLETLTVRGGGEIPYETFKDCSELTTVTVENAGIGNKCFYNCSKLAKVTLGENVPWIGFSAFSGCKNLKYNGYDNALYLGNNNNPYVVLISAKSEDITNCTISDKCKVIGTYAFRDCSGLTSVIIPDSVTSIGPGAFRDCSRLTSVTIGNGVTSIGGHAFSGCDGLTSITIPDSVTSIGDSAFWGCSELTSVTIGNGVTSIGDAFSYCSRLKYNEYDNGLYLGNGSNPYVVLIKAKSTDITSCVINEGCKVVADYAFNRCESLTNIVIPDGVTSIGYGAFSGCKNLKYNEYDNALYLGNNNNPYVVLISAKSEDITNCTISDKCKVIAESAFRDCSRLTSVTIPDSVTFISNSAFRDCSRLTSVVMGNGVTSIGINAFSNCGSLKKVFYKGTDSQWENISIGYLGDSWYLAAATRYYYSESQPTESGNYWRYVDGKIVIWNKEN